MLRIIRPTNLLILALTQFIIYYFFLFPLREMESISLDMNSFMLTVLILITISIAVAGYIINDYFDYELDKDNKLKFQFKNKQNYLKAYYVIIAAFFIATLLLANAYGNIGLSFIYIIATILLFLYASHLKSTVLTGNLLVAMFSSGVIGIIIFSEWSTLQELKTIDFLLYKETTSLLYAFVIFSFLISFAREIIKDVEDMDNDKFHGLKTIAIQFGMNKSKLVICFILGLLFLCIIYWSFSIEHNRASFRLFLSGLLLIIPCIWLIVSAVLASSKSDFSRLSKLSKINMALALFYLILYQ